MDCEYPYLILDARYEKVRENGVIRSRAVLVVFVPNFKVLDKGRSRAELVSRESGLGDVTKTLILGSYKKLGGRHVPDQLLQYRACVCGVFGSSILQPGVQPPAARCLQSARVIWGEGTESPEI